MKFHLLKRNKKSLPSSNLLLETNMPIKKVKNNNLTAVYYQDILLYFEKDMFGVRNYFNFQGQFIAYRSLNLELPFIEPYTLMIGRDNSLLHINPENEKMINQLLPYGFHFLCKEQQRSIEKQSSLQRKLER